MEPFTTYLFERSKNFTGRQILHTLLIAAAFLLAGILVLLGLAKIGIGTFISFGILWARIKASDDKNRGITAYGKRGAKFMIGETYFQMGDRRLEFSELTDLIIYVDEYLGKPRPLIGVHHGGNNEIRFKHQGKPYKLWYIIKNREDYQRVEELVDKIEKDMKG